jgi:hypothetical protein
MSKPQRSRQRKNPLVSQNISHSGPVPYEEKFVCQLCNKSFNKKYELKNHKKTIRHQKLKNKLKQDQEKRDVDILVGEMSSDFDMTANISGDFTENMANSGVQFHCNVCDVFCTDQEAFMNHMSAYHEEKKPFATRLINNKGTVYLLGQKIISCTYGAITEMVPDLIWALDFFSLQEIWSSRNLSPKKLGSCIKMPYTL